MAYTHVQLSHADLLRPVYCFKPSLPRLPQMSLIDMALCPNLSIWDWEHHKRTDCFSRSPALASQT
ncbi:hypothetical protein K456DRAFT_49736 [Colletotrichum gloeosporioides 23]|nr:hypothetical protein K456DRAFT_49736 [Colletotrichum gloeosporioides 23]